jgi:exodeoxyribonuclease-3
VATWNLNSLRARTSAVDRFLERAQPDVLCLQETKSADIPPQAMAVFDRHGYHVVHVGVGAYNGVALASRQPLRDVLPSGEFDDAALDREPRLITARVDVPIPMRIVSVYVPHGRALDHWHFQYKLDFLDALTARLAGWLDEGHVVLGGDVNVAATDSDVFHPDAFEGRTHVSPQERAALTHLYGAGLVDIDADVWGGRARRFTWWDHGIGYSRNLGMRLDHLAADPALAARVNTTWIDHIERGADRPSDHAALLADFRLREADNGAGDDQRGLDNSAQCDSSDERPRDPRGAPDTIHA